jgi:hypothetical protein
MATPFRTAPLRPRQPNRSTVFLGAVVALWLVSAVLLRLTYW